MMKRLAVIVGVGLLGCFVFAQGTAFATDNSTGNKQGKEERQKPKVTAAELEKHIAKREEDAKAASARGETEIAAVLNKLVGDLKNMKAALEKNDMAAFKAAEEQRKKDRDALDALKKSSKPDKKQAPPAKL